MVSDQGQVSHGRKGLGGVLDVENEIYVQHPSCCVMLSPIGLSTSVGEDAVAE
jgi:hypothetical protein